ncbi:acetyl-CoA acetyltransferase [Parasphingorhabdus sp.]|uniref:acetyl-CoA acetyltransferase n=1 Tax=Parasphingorhabdus sp. TaxID=2709688 RepID=UPI002F93D86E
MTQTSAVPVIIGVGQILGNSDRDGKSWEVADLIQDSLLCADQDAGGNWLDKIEFLGVENQTSSDVAPWPQSDGFMDHLLAHLEIAPAQTMLTDEPSGDGPVALLNHLANLIAAGEVEIGAIVGGEALRTAARRSPEQLAAQSNAMRELMEESVSPFLRQYGLVTPTDVYPLYETATRAHWGQSLAEAQDETATLWAAFSEAAVANPGAWIQEEYSADMIRTVNDRNRMITFPYTKLMVANNSVNMGAAVIVTNLDKALAMGVPQDQMVFVGAGAAAHESEDFLARDSYTASPAMQVSISTALELNNLGADDLDFVELYSCFPCVVKMARRVLDWPLERSPSVYGGLTFGGGPIGNCMMHAIVVMTQKLRKEGRNGLIFANGGFATHNHSIILTREKPDQPRFPQDFNYQAEADRLRGPRPDLDESYTGPGMIEAYSVPYGRDGKPVFGTIVARSPYGKRFVSRVAGDDLNGLSFLTSGQNEPVGTHGYAETAADGLSYWQGP